MAQPRKKKNSTRSSRRDKVVLPRVRCVIFDLDDTLYDCFRQRVSAAHLWAARAMVRAGLRASVEAVHRERMRAFRVDPTLRYIDAVVCDRFQAADPEAVSHAAREAYFLCPVGKLTLFRGTLPLLKHLHHHGVRTFVVSFGEPKIQHAKIRSLGLHNHPHVESILYADRDKLLTKEAAFRQIQQLVELPAEEMLVIGDRPMSEIRAGNELGMHTVRVHRGEFVVQQPQSEMEEPDYVVEDISRVKTLPFTWGTK